MVLNVPSQFCLFPELVKHLQTCNAESNSPAARLCPKSSWLHAALIIYCFRQMKIDFNLLPKFLARAKDKLEPKTYFAFSPLLVTI